MTANVYLLRPTTRSNLSSDEDHRDTLFGPFRLKSSAEISNSRFEHCTFANISFKDATLDRCTFEDCVFLCCYFRKTEIRGSTFLASKFLDCEFSGTIIQQCTFRFTNFRGCVIDYSELKSNLPSEPQLQFQLANNMAVEAEILGEHREARKYRLLAVKAHEEHLKASFLAKGSYYQSHFVGAARVLPLMHFVVSKAKGWLWGHGEKGWRLFLNFLLVTLLVFPLIFFAKRDCLSSFDSPQQPISFAKILLYSFDNVLAGAGFSRVFPTTDIAATIAAAEVLFGLVALGLFVALVFKTLARR